MMHTTNGCAASYLKPPDHNTQIDSSCVEKGQSLHGGERGSFGEKVR